MHITTCSLRRLGCGIRSGVICSVIPTGRTGSKQSCATVIVAARSGHLLPACPFVELSDAPARRRVVGHEYSNPQFDMIPLPGNLRFLILLKRWIVGQDGPKRNSSRRNPAYSSFCNNFETCQIHPMPTLKLLSSSGLEFSSTSKWLPKLRRSHCATWGAGCISGNLDL